MRRILALLSAFFLALSAFAQTPEEIVTKMEEVMDQFDKGDAHAMSMEMTFPIVGTVTGKVWSWGRKFRNEIVIKGHKGVVFIDGDTLWIYIPEDNEVRIKHSDPGKETKGKTIDTSLSEQFRDFSEPTFTDGISDGYDIFLDKETATAWYLRCKKKKSNKDKNDPKTMDLVVAKGTFYPLSVSTKMLGMSIKMYDMGVNVTEKQVTFNPADYPGVTIIDER